MVPPPLPLGACPADTGVPLAVVRPRAAMSGVLETPRSSVTEGIDEKAGIDVAAASRELSRSRTTGTAFCSASSDFSLAVGRAAGVRATVKRVQAPAACLIIFSGSQGGGSGMSFLAWLAALTWLSSALPLSASRSPCRRRARALR